MAGRGEAKYASLSLALLVAYRPFDVQAAEQKAKETEAAAAASLESTQQVMLQQLEAARSEAATRLEAAREEMDGRRRELEAAVAAAAAELADTKQQYEARLLEQQVRAAWSGCMRVRECARVYALGGRGGTCLCIECKHAHVVARHSSRN